MIFDHARAFTSSELKLRMPHCVYWRARSEENVNLFERLVVGSSKLEHFTMCFCSRSVTESEFEMLAAEDKIGTAGFISVGKTSEPVLVQATTVI